MKALFIMSPREGIGGDNCSGRTGIKTGSYNTEKDKGKINWPL